jgi:putative transposase
MARIARVVVPKIVHHITQRGNRAQRVFLGEEDYRAYIEIMSEWCRRCGVRIWAYCLMPNHVHLIAVPRAEESLARALGEAHRRYTRMINFRENWRGYLWQGRFASFPLDNQYLLVAARYVELNPVRAGLAQKAWEYEWSSASAHLRGEDDKLVKSAPLLELAGDWRAFLEGGVQEGELALLRRHERTGRPLGSEKFIARLERRLGRPLRRRKPGPKPKS